MHNRESLFKYQPSFYNIQRNNDVKHRGMKMTWNNKSFPSFNVINGKPAPYVGKVVLRHYHYSSGPKLGPGIVAIIRIPYGCHAWTKYYLYLKEEFNQQRYGRVNH